MMRGMLECETLKGVNLMIMQSPGYIHGGSTGGVDGHVRRRGGQGTRSPAGPELVSVLWAPSTETQVSPLFPVGMWKLRGLAWFGSSLATYQQGHLVQGP